MSAMSGINALYSTGAAGSTAGSGVGAATTGAAAMNPWLIGGVAGAQLLGGLFSQQAQAEEADRQRKLQGTLGMYAQQTQNNQAATQAEQQAFQQILNSMRMGG
jgi:hypothetical protein